MKKLLFTTIAAGFLAVSASAESVSIPQNSEGCYEISTALQLKGFAQGVNGKTIGSTSCALLMNDIQYNNGVKVVKDDLTGLAGGSVTDWYPIQEFAGSFDGQGHTVYGLYYKGDTDGGFFASLSGTAVLKNVHVRDSYFAADERVAGIVADVKENAKISMDRVSFKGIVTLKKTCSSSIGKANGHMGGLIGTVSKGAEIVNLSNSYNEGTITAGKCQVYSDAIAGLVGSVQDAATGKTLELNVTNCYNAGTVNNNGVGSSDPSIVGSVASGAKISATDIGCTAIQKTYCTKASSAETLRSNYESNIDKQIEAALNDPENPTQLATVEKTDGKRIATLKLSETEDMVKISTEVLVDSVVLDREFTTNRSTITLPFSISVSNVVDYKGEPVTFSKLSNMIVTDDNKWEIETTDLEVGAINAHTPYLVQAKNAGPLTFKGSVTLKATTDGVAKSSDVTYDGGNWTFKGVYTKVVWADDERAQDGCDECGRAYLFSKNKFVKVGKNGSALPYRAYLLAPVPFKPAVMAKMVANAGDLTVAENPNEITIRSLGTDANEYPTVEVISTTREVVESIIDSDEVQAIKNPLMIPANRSNNKWRDVKGRTMNHKPTAKGAYVNNNIPVIVK